jgi:hypothetical protein
MFLSTRHRDRNIGIAVVGLALSMIAIFFVLQQIQVSANGEKDHSERTLFTSQEELATIWANALKERDGKARYEIMSENAKKKFEHEQAMQDGSINFVIGVSSPWVEHFEIEHKDLTAVITYFTKTSEAAYSSKEMISFVKENGKLLVDDYKYIYRDKLLYVFPEYH